MSVLPPFLHGHPDGCIIELRVVPRAGQTALSGARAGVLLVRLAAAPVDGAANEALVDLLASVLQIPKRQVVLLSGERARAKRVLARGLSPAAVAERLTG